jgi:Asp-tRNA(Asn)/Glu-tRNA(Gln) amidotransferase C subunit
MKITIDIEENQFNTFLQFIRTLDYVRVENEEKLLDAQVLETRKRMDALERGEMEKKPWSEAKENLFSAS